MRIMSSLHFYNTFTYIIRVYWPYNYDSINFQSQIRVNYSRCCCISTPLTPRPPPLPTYCFWAVLNRLIIVIIIMLSSPINWILFECYRAYHEAGDNLIASVNVCFPQDQNTHKPQKDQIRVMSLFVLLRDHVRPMSHLQTTIIRNSRKSSLVRPTATGCIIPPATIVQWAVQLPGDFSLAQ